jgi:hypothetical protein
VNGMYKIKKVVTRKNLNYYRIVPCCGFRTYSRGGAKGLYTASQCYKEAARDMLARSSIVLPTKLLDPKCKTLPSSYSHPWCVAEEISSARTIKSCAVREGPRSGSKEEW